MNKKGFTLIELLAVIVILAIIALIATPIILGIIDDARKEAKQRTAELVVKGVELAYTSYLFDTNGAEPDDACDFMTNEFFAMNKGELGTCSENSVVVTANNVEFTITYGNGVATMTTTDADVDLSTLGTIKLASN